MKKVILSILLFVSVFAINAQVSTQNAARYRNGLYDGTYIHGVDNLGNPAASGDPSHRELPPGITNGVYSWWNYGNSVGQPSGSHGAAIGFGNGQAGSAEIWTGWTNGKLYTRFLRDCCQGWSAWNEIWTANTDGTGSGLDADTVDGLQPVLIQSSGKVDILNTNNKRLWLNSNDESAVTFVPNNGNSIFHLSHGHDNKLYLSHGSTVGAGKLMTFVNNGNVGIGTTTPDAKLAVNGNIHTKEVKVDLIGWSDFVFKDSYKLPTLKEVEQHIKEKGHLKDIPSEEEVKKEGIYLGEMDSKLLQKIEELTLYTIEQEKRIESLEVKNEKLIVLVEKLLKAKIEE